MYRQQQMQRTTLKVNTSYAGVSIETKVRRLLNNKERITESNPLTYTDRKYGVLKEMDIRTDKWEVAVEAQEKVASIHQLHRKERIENRPEEKAAREAAAAAEAAKTGKTGSTPATGT